VHDEWRATGKNVEREGDDRTAQPSPQVIIAADDAEQKLPVDAAGMEKLKHERCNEVAPNQLQPH
jgi:hypothetical protein